MTLQEHIQGLKALTMAGVKLMYELRGIIVIVLLLKYAI